MQRLTLCMIVKNEERFLEGCLASVSGLVNAIVLVDTGSTDRTLEIARRHGAKLVKHGWNDDFAQARNAALPHVRDGFVLVLDADERLGPGAQRAIREALSRDNFDCGMLPLHDASTLEAGADEIVSGRARRGDPVHLPRLLRVSPDLRWEGVVHEQVTSWARGKRIANLAAPIVHYGAVPELRAARGKSDRNLRLLERRAELEPHNPTVLAYLARELERQADPRALDVARQAWSAVHAPEGARPACDVVLPATLAAFLAIRAGRLDEALAVLAQARPWSDPHPNLDLLEGLAHERRALRSQDVETFAAELLAARELYGALERHRGKCFWAEVLPGALGAVGATRLGTVELLLADPAAAERAFERALECDPGMLEARLGRIEARLDAGRAAEVLAALTSLLTPDCADAWVLAAAAAHALGAASDAQLYAASARTALRMRPWIADFRRGRLDELEAVLAAAARVELSEQPPNASVVIPAFNRLDLLEPVLRGFQRQRDVAPFELVLVDDGSQPRARELFEALATDPNWRLVEHAANRGRGAALNTGFGASSGEVVIFCDSDIEPTERFVAEHLEFHRRSADPRTSCLGALDYGVDAGLFGALMGARSNPRLRGGSRRAPWTQWFTDNWSFRRALLAEHGLRFDERHRVWGWEELDLAWQLDAAGATNQLVECARGKHLKAATLDGQLASFARSVPNLELLASKRPGDRIVEGWRCTRFASAGALARAEAGLQAVWLRANQLDRAAPEFVRDVSAPPVHEFAVQLSDLVFLVGITRGLLGARAEFSAAQSAGADRALDTAVAAALRALSGLVTHTAARIEAPLSRSPLAATVAPRPIAR